jgi:hypothetical protein
VRHHRSTPCATLAQDVAWAVARAEDALVRRIVDAGQQDWRAALAVLERKHPEVWAQRLRVEIDKELRATMSAIEEVVDGETFERILERVARLTDGSDRGIDADEAAIDAQGVSSSSSIVR